MSLRGEAVAAAAFKSRAIVQSFTLMADHASGGALRHLLKHRRFRGFLISAHVGGQKTPTVSTYVAGKWEREAEQFMWNWRLEGGGD